MILNWSTHLFDEPSVVNKLDYYYNLMEINPYVFHVNSIAMENLKKLDAVSVIGNDASIIAKYVTENYPNNSLHLYGAWLTDEKIIERGDSGYGNKLGMVSVVSKERCEKQFSQHLNKKIFTLDKLISFVILHATGHNAGSRFKHEGNFGKKDLGYMNNGQWLYWALIDWSFTKVINYFSQSNIEYVKKRFLK